MDGAPLELPRDTRARGVTRVTHGNGPVAALIHDPTLDTDSDVVEELAATSLMLLENTRLVEDCARRGRGSSRPPSASDDALSAISTTARSSGCWRSTYGWTWRAS